jgi:hypothetical protein
MTNPSEFPPEVPVVKPVAEKSYEEMTAEDRLAHDREIYQREVKERTCADCATYVKMHKAIIVPAEEVPEEIKVPGKAWMGATLFQFIDKNGNLCEIDVRFEEIQSLLSHVQMSDNERSTPDRQYYHPVVVNALDVSSFFVNELKRSGFNIEHRTPEAIKARGMSQFQFDKISTAPKVGSAIEAHKIKIEEESRKQRMEELNKGLEEKPVNLDEFDF